MEQRPQQMDKREQEEQESRGVVIPYLKRLSEKFRRTANRHSFRVALKPESKIKEIKEKIKNWRVERNDILVIYDVEYLYPSIHIDKALELVEKLLNENENLGETTTTSVTSIMELLKWTFELTYCEDGGSHFVLDSGPIGLGAAGEIAIIYMEDSN